jgi:sugar/nucleoside kinase (ribokinase family)
MKIDVLCLGHACYDIIFPVQDFPRENLKYTIPATEESPGGPACNGASLLGKWGVPCSLAALVGDDIYADLIIREMAGWGVDTSLVQKRAGHVTPLSCIIASGKNGSRTIINRRNTRARLALTEEDFKRQFPDPPAVLLFDGHEPEASFAAMRAFPGARTILDAGSLREGTDALSREVDYCIVSEIFARQAAGFTGSGESQAAALNELSRRGARHVAITLGEQGGCYLAAGPSVPAPGRVQVRRYAPYPAKAIDSTAAGDIFHGAFACAVLKGYDFSEALEFSAVAAGLSVERRGGRGSIPGLEEVLPRVNLRKPSSSYKNYD